jgi:hypothetical protein
MISDYPPIAVKMSKERYSNELSYKRACWRFLVKNARSGLLQPGPYQSLGETDRREVSDLEKKFKKQWNSDWPNNKMN